jgi:adenylosuccinate synthase
MAGFTEDLSECRSEQELPEAARDYLRFISDFVGVSVALIGVGPGREQVIWTEAAGRMAPAGGAGPPNQAVRAG